MFKARSFSRSAISALQVRDPTRTMPIGQRGWSGMRELPVRRPEDAFGGAAGAGSAGGCGMRTNALWVGTAAHIT